MFIEREILENIIKWIDKNKIIILKGSRQVGKTTILKEIKKVLDNKGKNTIYFSLDNELNNKIFQDSKLFLQFIKDQYNDKFVYIFLDEFQYLGNNAGIFLKAVFDNLEKNGQLIISGSSSLEITKNSEFLTGRKIDFNINTFNFREFLLAKSEYKFDNVFDLKKIEELKNFNKIYENELKLQFCKYLSFGGYPDVVIENDLENKDIILKNLINTYVLKDVAGFLKISNVKEFNNLAKILSLQIGSLVNKAELTNTINLNILTLNKYIDILEGTYIISLLKPLYKNTRKELSKMPKIFINDFGIKKILLSENEIIDYDFIDGSIVENFVFLELKDRFDLDNLFFYRTVSGAEIDFIVKKKDFYIPIEVKFRNKINIETGIILKSFTDEYKSDFKIIITKDILEYNKEENILFLPVYLISFFEF